MKYFNKKIIKNIYKIAHIDLREKIMVNKKYIEKVVLDKNKVKLYNRKRKTILKFNQ